MRTLGSESAKRDACSRTRRGPVQVRSCSRGDADELCETSRTEPLLERVEFFDLFAGTEIGEGKKSLAYRLTYRDRSRTLTSEEVNAAHAKIRERLRSDLGAELRE